MKFSVLFTLLFVFANFSFAQSLNEDNIPDEFYYLQFKRSKFIMLDENKSVLDHKLNSNDLMALFDGNEKALKHYQNYRSLNTAKWITRGVFMGLIIYGLGKTFSRNGNYESGIYYYLGGLGGMLGIQLPISISSGNQAKKATDSHNKRTRKLQKEYGLNIGVTDKGVGLVFNF